MTETWAEWLTRDVQPSALASIRDRVLDAAHVGEGDLVLDLGAGTGLLAEGARHRGDAVVAVEPDASCRVELEARGFQALSGRAERIPLEDCAVDAAVRRSVLIYTAALDAAARELFRGLRPGGRFAAFEPTVDAILDAVGAPGQPSRRERWTSRYGDEITSRLVAHLESHAEQVVSLHWLSLFVAARKP